MNLFNETFDSSKNYLPKDGEVNYFGKILDLEKANHFYDTLIQTIDWQNDQAMMYGKIIVTKRKVAWYGDLPFSYTYSKITKQALPWTAELLELKSEIEQISGERFNSCLLNLYHNGDEGMAWHSDGEKELKKNGAIASLSLGAEESFLSNTKKQKKAFLFI